MIRSSLVKSACVAIALSGFSPPQAGAIEAALRRLLIHAHAERISPRA